MRVCAGWGPRLVTALLLIAGLGSIWGCVKIDGGAAEFSWSVRDEQDQSVGCSAARIGEIRLCWQSLADAGSVLPQCRPPDVQSFPCIDPNGLTGFRLPPGRTSLFIEPVCSDGTPAVVGSYAVPPPLVRDVEEGRVVTLDTLLVVVKRTNCCTSPDDTDCNLCTCRGN